MKAWRVTEFSPACDPLSVRISVVFRYYRNIKMSRLAFHLGLEDSA